MPAGHPSAYDRRMQSSGQRYPGPPPGVEQWHRRWMDDDGRRRSHPGRLIFPVIFSLAIQLPSVFVTFTADHHPERLHLGTVTFWSSFVLAVIGPLALLLSRRFPGP